MTPKKEMKNISGNGPSGFVDIPANFSAFFTASFTEKEIILLVSLLMDAMKRKPEEQQLLEAIGSTLSKVLMGCSLELRNCITDFMKQFGLSVQMVDVPEGVSDEYFEKFINTPTDHSRIN